MRIILSKTSHPGNIGGVARAMKNMGLSQLSLIAPKSFPHTQAKERASGAVDILNSAQVVPDLEAAIQDCQWVYGTSGRMRAFPWPQLSPREAAAHIKQQADKGQQVAVVFGNEQSGLSNEELQLCDYHIAIPTVPDFGSLNLACAVQIIAYEWYVQSEMKSQETIPMLEEEKASHEAVQGLVSHWTEVAEQVGFFDSAHPKKFIPRLQKLVTKSQLTSEEIHLLRGFLKRVGQRELL